MKTEKQNRRQFLQASATIPLALTFMKNIKAETIKSSEQNIELNEITINDLQAKMKSGELTARQIAEKYLARIKEIDPKLNSVIEINPDALQIADDLDKERKAGKLRGALHGIPILIKDNIDTADKMHTTAGSLALLNAPTPKQDAFLVQQLRKAGAVILGKTNLSEWANFRSTKSSSGWSGRGGQTHNPYVLDRNPCGSSSGTGSAIAANLAAVGIGTETDGSIICPSATCGIVGIKPTLGLVSRSGVIPIAHSQDTAGPMARTVTDAAILLGVLVGTDKSDSITSQATKGEKDYTRFLQKDGLKNLRIGVGRQTFGHNDKVDKVIEPHLQALKNGGATLIDVEFPTLQQFGDDEFQVLLYEFKEDLNKYLATRGGQYKTLADLIKFNEANREKEMPFFGQEIFLQAQEKADLNDRAYRLALLKTKVLTQEQGIDGVMDKNKLDAFFAPSGGAAWMTDLVNGDCGVFEGLTSLAAVSGYPSITVPAGYIQGLPVGITFFGRAFSEPTLIKIAYAFEQATKARRTPKFLPTYAEEFLAANRHAQGTKQ
ncbi:MAG: amidase [Acidobacteriota bacterium]|nr:amidase [Acidobacteriota bacterium]